MIAHFCSDFDSKGNNRFNYIAELLANNEFDVELVTSNFSHTKKMKRKMDNLENLNYKVTFIEEPNYYKNVSIKRFYSHYIMGKNLKKYLKNRKKPDVVYCAIPSLDVAKVTAEYARKNNIRFVVDIQDIWPEAFKMVFNIPLISNILFYPMQRRADYIYAEADDIVAVSQTYADRGLRVNRKCKKEHVIFLGTELVAFDKLVENNKIIDKPKDEIWLAYVGTLGHSYDLNAIIDALKVLKNKGIKNIKFIVMGDGPLKSKFEKHAEEQKIYSEFTGRLDYAKMVGVLSSCDIAVNPIKHGAAQSIINKVGDYAAAGLPVINTQENEEYRELLTKYYAGVNCKNNDVNDMANKLLELYRDEKLRETIGKNSRRLAEEKFDRLKTYQELIKLIREN